MQAATKKVIHGEAHDGSIQISDLHCSGIAAHLAWVNIAVPTTHGVSTMAGSSLLALIDDIATILDDVALMSKMAAKKTAGVLGDDLALNAQQVAGVRAERELPVVWAVGVGSLKNKAILVPPALAISAFAPWAITPLLMLGGLYLCFEGFEKIAHSLLHKGDDEHKNELHAALANPDVDLVALEKTRSRRRAHRLHPLGRDHRDRAGHGGEAPFIQQVTVVVGIALLMTVGVYGLVAAIVKWTTPAST
jgi:predicted DNA repair protein MutK